MSKILPRLAFAASGLFAASIGGAQTITEFTIPTANSEPWDIAAGPDGNLWFTESFGTAHRVSRITPAGTITEFPVEMTAQAFGIAAGPDGALWFCENAISKIGRLTTAGDVTDEFPLLTANSRPYAIVTGPDGNLWFTEFTINKIGRMTPAGVVTDFPIPTVSAGLRGIAAGPDGNLWFVEQGKSKIGRITPAGAVTEFPTPTLSSSPTNITAGPDGNLWFTEETANQIGRITPAGVITEFPIPTAASAPTGIAGGPDGNLWFTEFLGHKIGRITPAGVITEFPVLTADASPLSITAGPDGALWFVEFEANKVGRITTGALTPSHLSVDAHAVSGTSSNLNDVLESGETVEVSPSWTNTLDDTQAFAGTASGLTGPAGPVYTIDDASTDYGNAPGGATIDCHDATGDCARMTVSGARPSPHWDAAFEEALDVGTIEKEWKLHVGESFPDVPTTHPFYAFIENLFHNGVTGGCAGGGYCPGASVTRAQMAVFLLKGKLGAASVPPAPLGTVFGDVSPGDFAAAWIEQLAGFQVTGGCGGGQYCPSSPVTRAQMAVFLLKAKRGSAYVPPPCAGAFDDIPCPGPFTDWIEQLAAEGITGGCGTGNYCPGNPVTRGQMAVFLVKTFGLRLYGP